LPLSVTALPRPSIDADPETTYLAAAKLLGDLGVGYLHIAEADWDDAPVMPADFKRKLREAFPNVIIYAGKYTGERAREAIEQGWADLIAFGRPFVANPDLPERLRQGATLASHDRDTLFGGGARAHRLSRAGSGRGLSRRSRRYAAMITA
jgi:N-ethylmaleimide reductase